MSSILVSNRGVLRRGGPWHSSGSAPTVATDDSTAPAHPGIVVADTTNGPTVPWTGHDGAAFRLAIVDEDNSWACALIITSTRAHDNTGDAAGRSCKPGEQRR